MVSSTTDGVNNSGMKEMVPSDQACLHKKQEHFILFYFILFNQSQHLRLILKGCDKLKNIHWLHLVSTFSDVDSKNSKLFKVYHIY